MSLHTKSISVSKSDYCHLFIDHYDKSLLFGYDLKKDSSICIIDINLVQKCI